MEENKGIITCDYKEVLELVEEMIHLTNEKLRYFIMVDTNSDQFAVVWSFDKITKEEAQKYYDNWMEDLLNS